MRGMIVAMGLAALVLAGCAGGPVQYQHRFGRDPETGKMVTVSPGDVVYTEFDYMAVEGAVLGPGFSDYVGLSKVVVVPGTLLVKAGQDYCTTVNAMYALAGNPVGEACFRDTNGDGRFDQVGGGQNFMLGITPTPYTQQAVGAGSGFRKELLYQGVQGETVRLSYREFSNDMARPAFQQDLTYNMEKAPPTAVTFKGARIEIEAADNNTIRYRVMSGFTSD